MNVAWVLQGRLGRSFRPDRPGRARAERRGQSLMLVSHLPSVGPCEGGHLEPVVCSNYAQFSGLSLS